MSDESSARFDAFLKKMEAAEKAKAVEEKRLRQEAAEARRQAERERIKSIFGCDEIPSRNDASSGGARDGGKLTTSASGVLQRAGSRWTFSHWEQADVEDRESSDSFVLVAKEAGGIRLHAHWCSDRCSASVSKSQEVCDGPIDGCFESAEDISGLPWRKTAACASEGFRWGKKGTSSESGGAGEVRAKLAEIAALEGMPAEMMAAFVEGFAAGT